MVQMLPYTTSSAIRDPRGRQIVATLLNGEVIEGFTPNMFNPDCERFFVVATDDDGETSWALVERAGAAGVLTEKFREGIYTEEPRFRLPARSGFRHYINLRSTERKLRSLLSSFRFAPMRDVLGL